MGTFLQTKFVFFPNGWSFQDQNISKTYTLIKFSEGEYHSRLQRYASTRSAFSLEIRSIFQKDLAGTAARHLAALLLKLGLSFARRALEKSSVFHQY